jgi:GDPmannose 4,6-dehydratase
MWLMLQQAKPDDYVLATGQTHSVREFVERAFAEVGITIVWKGKDTGECGICNSTGRTLVRVDPAYFRPAEVDCLLGDATKAHNVLGWTHKIGFLDLVKEMVASDLAAIRT